MAELITTLKEYLISSKSAAAVLRRASTETKNRVLLAISKSLFENSAEILSANRSDVDYLPDSVNAAFKDRLTLNPARLEAMAESLRQVAALKDPVGEVIEEKKIAGDLKTKRVRAPLGVIFMIFESRPNVAVEAFSLAFKSGNACILRGGKESQKTVGVFYALIHKALHANGLPEEVLWGITDSDREIVNHLLTERKYIDVVVPRGGDRLIEFITEHSKIPVIKNVRGLCHLYVDASADLQMAFEILKNGKVQRPGVCNALETLLIHESVKPTFLEEVFQKMPEVEFFIDRKTLESLPAAVKALSNVSPAGATSFDTEYLDLKMSVKKVASLEIALEHIADHGSKHSECIVTKDESNARRFQNEVDCACVYWNASTRFTDGFQLGLGGELGISTQKLHVRGPVGLNELTSLRWIFDGTGQIRNT